MIRKRHGKSRMKRAQAHKRSGESRTGFFGIKKKSKKASRLNVSATFDAPSPPEKKSRGN